ncbi:hypothetical protein MJH12_12205 [bacterium]|nr:hypothetical protein [bacterium]
MKKITLLFLLNLLPLFANTTKILSFVSTNDQSQIKSIVIIKDLETKKLTFSIVLHQPFIIESKLFDSIESQVEASKLQISRRENPYLSPAESTLINMMASMDDQRPKSYDEAYHNYQKRQYNGVMNRLQNPQNYYHHSSNNNTFFEKEVNEKTRSVLIPALILGIKGEKQSIFFHANDKYEVQVFHSSKKKSNISYQRNKTIFTFEYNPGFEVEQVSLALFDEDDFMIEHLSNEQDQFSYRGAWHLLQDQDLIPFHEINDPKLIIRK